MVAHVTKRAAWLLWLAGLLILAASATMAQDGTGTRTLTSGATLNGALGAENLAQVYTFGGAADETVSLSVATDEGVALALLLTDSLGQSLAQAADQAASGAVALEDVALPQSGVYYVTVFPLAPAEADFSITLTSDAAAGDAVTTPAQPQTRTVVQPGSVLTTTGLDISVTWNSSADLNLEVRDPVGGSLFWDTPTTDSGGSFVGPNVNGGCEFASADAPTEAVRWPPGAIPTGSYELLIYHEEVCDVGGPVSFTINAVVNGEPIEPVEGTLQPGEVFVTSLIIDGNAAATTGPGGLDTQDALPAPVAELLQNRRPIEREVPVQGVITHEKPYAVFSFPGQANDIVSINLNATSGNLDTFLLLLDPNGNIIDSNDDQTFDATDSAILNRRLVTGGVYSIVATRYAQTVGGTEGNFTLSVSGATADLPPEVLALDLPRGSIEVSLLWDTNADLQLLVRDPAGDSVFDDVPNVPSGGQLNANGNVNCNPSPTRPVSFISWPDGRLPAGSYEVEVWYQDTCGDTRPVTATLNIFINGSALFSDSILPLPGQKYLTSFNIDITGQATASEGGIIGGSETLNYQAQLELAREIASNETVTGTITADKKFELYAFEGQAGDVVSIAMEATAGTLDTLLFVIDPNGIEIAQNDDAVVGETTDSLVSNLTLPQDGRYIIIATHFGASFGGTTGVYNLIFSRLR